MTNLSDIVQTLCGLGYSIVPSKGKHPSIKWKPYQTRLPTDAEHRSWRYNMKPTPELYGIVTGELSKIVVVDCDDTDAMDMMGDLQPHVRTPRDGGHYYFQHPGHFVKTVAGLLPKIDIRADGGFANAVGTTPKGEYRVEIMPTPEAIYSWDKMPEAILDAMVKPASKAPEAKPGELIPEGERNATLTRLAGSMRRPGMTSEEIYAALVGVNRLRCQPPLDEEEVRTIAQSVSRYEPGDAHKQSEAPEIISARALSEMDFPELKFALPGMIPEGFTILAGRPKSGKSWWSLQAAYSVALGKNLLDGSPCERGGALVLGLEDGKRRLQYRVNRLNDSASVIKWWREKGSVHISGYFGGVPEGLNLAIKWPKIGDGCVEELEKYLDRHPDTRLIVIDIIKRIIQKKGKGAAYDEDYQSVQPLQELATRRRVAILGVHHTRKALADDPIEMVSGTFGLTGGADSVIVVQRATEGESKFSFSGRDLAMRELAMRFNDEDYMWTCLGDADVYFISEGREDILGCLLDNDSMSPSEIARSLGKNISTTKTLLSRMSRDGIVTRDSKGRYKYSARSSE